MGRRVRGTGVWRIAYLGLTGTICKLRLPARCLLRLPARCLLLVVGRPTLSGQPALTPAMHLVCNSANYAEQRVRVLEALVARGATLENRDGRSCTPLHRAAGVGALP